MLAGAPTETGGIGLFQYNVMIRIARFPSGQHVVGSAQRVSKSVSMHWGNQRCTSVQRDGYFTK